MNSARHATIVEADRLSKYYGRFAAVQNVSFQIAEGEIVALLGPNGAGKTTIMRMLTGYHAPSEGAARVGGFDITTDRLAATAQMGYLPENGPLYFDMTPLEVLRFFGGARGLTGAMLRERIAEVSYQCGLEPILDKPIGKLSKGLRQRVGMAQALLHDPALLIMDEPTAGLDPIQILHFRDHVRSLQRRKTILISTHILQEVDAIADRVLLIHNGRLVLDGTPEDLRGHESLEEHFVELIHGANADAPARAGTDSDSERSR
jgi:ABC-2 type transport system ATP-binding protein